MLANLDSVGFFVVVVTGEWCSKFRKRRIVEID